MPDKPKRRRRRATGRPKLHPVPDMPEGTEPHDYPTIAAALLGVEYSRATGYREGLPPLYDHVITASDGRPLYHFTRIIEPQCSNLTLAAWLRKTYGKRPAHAAYLVNTDGCVFLIQGNRGISAATDGKIVTSRKLPYRRSRITYIYKIMSAAHHDLIQRVKN